MKKVLFLLAVFCINISIAQNHMSNLEFKGIPIEGDSNNFGKKLEEQGFKRIKGNNDECFIGKFANKECKILLGNITNTNNIKEVNVLIASDIETWNSIKILYDEFKEQLTKKYGEPTKNMEFFKYPYKFSDSDNDKWTALIVGKATFASIFELDNGKIYLSIYKKGILLSYVDRQGDERSQAIQNQSFSNDL